MARQCSALGVSRSGLHAWLNRPPSTRTVADEVLAPQVRSSFLESVRTYGARRVWHDVLAAGFRCGLHKIERLMRAQALRARPRRRGLPKDHGERHPGSMPSNILDRQFAATRQNQKWVADFTYVWSARGLAARIDFFEEARKVRRVSTLPDNTNASLAAT